MTDWPDRFGIQAAASASYTESWDALRGAPTGKVWEGRDPDDEDSRPIPLVDGHKPEFLWRMVSSAAEWEEIERSGYIAAHGDGLFASVVGPDLRYHDGPTPGQRVIKLRWVDEDGWRSSWTGDQVDAFTRKPVPIDRIVAVTPPSNARGLLDHYGSKEAANPVHDIESATYWEQGYPKFYDLVEAREFFCRVLIDNGVENGDEGWVAWHPSGDPYHSAAGWTLDGAVWQPACFIGTQMDNFVTLLHEATHHILGQVTKRRGVAIEETQEMIDQAHDYTFRATFSRLLHQYLPGVGDILADRFMASKTASTTRLWRGLSLGSFTEAELQQVLANPEAFVRSSVESRAGIHWTDDPNSAYNFALGRDPEGYAAESWGSYDDDEGNIDVGLVLEAQVPDQGVLDRDSQEFEDYAFSDAIIDYSIEREVTVRDATKLDLTQVIIVWSTSDGMEQERVVPMRMTVAAVVYRSPDPVIQMLTQDGSELIKSLWAEDPRDAIATDLDLDNAPTMDEIERAREQARRDAAEYLADAPEVLTVHRGGPFGGSQYTSVTRQRSTAETFAGFAGEPVQTFTVNKSDVLAVMDVYASSVYAEDELIVRPDSLRPATTASADWSSPYYSRVDELKANGVVEGQTVYRGLHLRRRSDPLHPDIESLLEQVGDTVGGHWTTSLEKAKKFAGENSVSYARGHGDRDCLVLEASGWSWEDVDDRSTTSGGFLPYKAEYEIPFESYSSIKIDAAWGLEGWQVEVGNWIEGRDAEWVRHPVSLWKLADLQSDVRHRQNMVMVTGPMESPHYPDLTRAAESAPLNPVSLYKGTNLQQGITEQSVFLWDIVSASSSDYIAEDFVGVNGPGVLIEFPPGTAHAFDLDSYMAEQGLDNSYNQKEWLIAPGHYPVAYSEERDGYLFLSVGRGRTGSKVAAVSDYGGSHQPLEDGPTLDAMDQGWFPPDVYEHPEWYSFGDGADEAARVLHEVRGKPNAMVTIYRAIPPIVYGEWPDREPRVIDTIETGNWVAIARGYAAMHGDGQVWEEWIAPADPDNVGDDEGWIRHEGGWHILSAQVPAHTIRNGGSDIMEWGYWGPPVKARIETLPKYASIDSITPDMVKEILSISDPVIGSEGEWADCVQASELLAQAIDGVPTYGLFYDGDLDADHNFTKVMDHAWVTMPDGTIVDITQGQFGKGQSGVQILSPGHPMRRHYRDSGKGWLWDTAWADAIKVGSADYEGGGKVYVVEGVLDRAGLNGGPVDDESAVALAIEVSQFLGASHRPPVSFTDSGGMASWYGGDGRTRGATTGTGTVILNRDSGPTKLDLLHELAHSHSTSTEGHGPAWQELAATLYGRFISPEAEAKFRDLMSIDKTANFDTDPVGHTWRQVQDMGVDEEEMDDYEGMPSATFDLSKPVYIRFGGWPSDERSNNNVTGFKEEGVSVYEMDHRGYPSINWEGNFGNAQDDLVSRITDLRRRRSDDPVFMVQGDVIGTGQDGEPLLRNVRVIRRIASAKTASSTDHMGIDKAAVYITGDTAGWIHPDGTFEQVDFHRDYTKHFHEGCVRVIHGSGVISIEKETLRPMTDAQVRSLLSLWDEEKRHSGSYEPQAFIDISAVDEADDHLPVSSFGIRDRTTYTRAIREMAQGQTPSGLNDYLAPRYSFRTASSSRIEDAQSDGVVEGQPTAGKTAALTGYSGPDGFLLLRGMRVSPSRLDLDDDLSRYTNEDIERALLGLLSSRGVGQHWTLAAQVAVEFASDPWGKWVSVVLWAEGEASSVDRNPPEEAGVYGGSDEFEVYLTEGAPLRIVRVDIKPNDRPGWSVQVPSIQTTASLDESRVLYRGLSVDELRDARHRGYLQSDQRRDRGVGGPLMGTSAAEDVAVARSYAKDSAGSRGMVVEIQVRPEDGWTLNMDASMDGVQEWNTTQPIPMDRVSRVFAASLITASSLQRPDPSKRSRVMTRSEAQAQGWIGPYWHGTDHGAEILREGFKMPTLEDWEWEDDGTIEEIEKGDIFLIWTTPDRDEAALFGQPVEVWVRPGGNWVEEHGVLVVRDLDDLAAITP